MPAHRLRTLATLFAIATLAACGSEATQPNTTTGTYLLVAANGQPAPALIHSGPYADTGGLLEVHVVADTIRLLDGGRYEQRAKLEARVDGQLVSRSTWADHGAVTHTGSLLHFDSDYLQNVAFDGTLTSAGELRVTQNLAGEGTDDLYALRKQP